MSRCKIFYSRLGDSFSFGRSPSLRDGGCCLPAPVPSHGPLCCGQLVKQVHREEETLRVERVGGRTFSSDSEGQWSLWAIPRGPFSPLDSGLQVSHPGPTSWGTTCAGAQAPRSGGPVLVLRLCPRCPETLNFYTGPTFPVCTGPTHYAAGPGSYPQRRKTTV